MNAIAFHLHKLNKNSINEKKIVVIQIMNNGKVPLLGLKTFCINLNF